MTRQEIIDRINLLKMQLRVTQIDTESFIKNEGKSGLQERINRILDEMIELNRKLKNNDN